LGANFCGASWFGKPADIFADMLTHFDISSPQGGGKPMLEHRTAEQIAKLPARLPKQDAHVDGTILAFVCQDRQGMRRFLSATQNMELDRINQFM
jgi:hypothetical protein